MAKFWMWMDNFWNGSKTLAWLLVLCGLSLALWTFHWPQSPGVSIGILATVAGIMSIRPKMHPAEKTAWAVMLVIFAILEVLAIKRNDADNKTSRDQQNTAFQTIADGLKSSIETSKGQYESTIGHVDGVLSTTQSVAQLTKKNLLNITGGNSNVYFDFVYMNDLIPEIWLRNTGKYPLRNLAIRIEDVNKLENLSDSHIPRLTTMDDINKSTQDIRIGDLGFQQTTMIPAFPEAHGTDLVHYLISYSALNGGGEEIIYIRVGKDGKRHSAIWTGGSNQKEVKKIDPNFPPDTDGKLPWLGTP